MPATLLRPRGVSATLAALLAALVAAPASGAPAPELVPFASRDAARTPIGGALFRPAGDPPWPAVVMMPGCSGLYREAGDIQVNLAAWVDRFLEWGYLVLAVDGFTPRGFRSICAMRKRPLHPLDDRPFDAYGALAWLAAQPRLHTGRIALVGWSNGAMAALSGLREEAAERFGGALRFTAGAAFYPGCVTLRRRTAGTYRPYAPLLVLVGLADDWTLPEPCLALMGAARAAGAPVEIEGYPDARHAFDHPGLAQRTRIARDDAWKTKERRVTIGSNPAARAAAIARLRSWLTRHLEGR